MFNKKVYQETFDHVRASEQIRNQIIQVEANKTVPVRKTRILFLAAVIASLFLLTAFSCIQFKNYNNPAQILEGIFGKNGRSSYSAQQVITQYGKMQYGGGTRYELDMQLAEKYIAPYIYEVNQTIVSEKQAFTVEACIVDKASLTGALYYRLENPPEYQISNRGAIYWMCDGPDLDPFLSVEMDACNAIGNHLIVEAMTTENVLYGTYQFVIEKDCDWMRITLRDSQTQITIPIPEETQMPYIELDDGGIVMSPFGAAIDAKKYGITFRTLDVISIYLADGEEYELQWEDQAAEAPNLKESRYGCNVSFFSDSGKVVYIFSRVLDIEKVQSIVINGTEYCVQ